MRIRPSILVAALAAALAFAGESGAVTVELSTFSGESLGIPPVDFRNGDVVRYDTVTEEAAVVFNEDSFSGPEDVDAWEVLSNGNVLLSTFGSGTLGSLSFENGSVVEWDGTNASIVFNENLFLDPTAADIDAVAVHSNGNLLFSTRGPAQIGSLGFGDGDIVAWDGSTASIFFAESAFLAGDINVDGFDIAGDGTFLLSTFDDVTLDGVLYLNGDLILFDPDTGTASRVFPESRFGSAADIDAVAYAFAPVPEPGTAALFGLGLAGLAVAARSRPGR
jgi:hypothetical protein